MAGIDRTAAASLFEEQVAPQVVEKATQRSIALSTLPVIPMGSGTMRVPVLSALPTAAFLSADQDVKPQSAAGWADKLITAEEVAVIVPISESVIADSSIDVVSKVTDLIGQALAVAIDAAVFFGTNAPATYPSGGIHGVAATATQTVAALDAPGDDVNALYAILEDLGFDPTDVYAGRSYRSLLRGLKDGNGTPLYQPMNGSVNVGALYGVPLSYPLGWDGTKADLLAVDDSGVAMGLRQDVSIKMLDQATLTGFGNLAEKDSIAVRAMMRVGFQIANPVTLDAGAQVYPVAALTPKV